MTHTGTFMTGPNNAPVEPSIDVEARDNSEGIVHGISGAFPFFGHGVRGLVSVDVLSNTVDVKIPVKTNIHDVQVLDRHVVPTLLFTL